MKNEVATSRIILTIGKMASVLSIMMYVSYIPQIMDNLAGMKGNPLQPLVTAINCVLWVSYGVLKPKKDWPIVIANFPGIFLGFGTFLTAL